MHLAISGLDLVNVYGSAPELKALPHSLTFSTVMSIYVGLFLAQIIIFGMG